MKDKDKLEESKLLARQTARVAAMLGESGRRPLGQIRFIIANRGIEFVKACLRAAKQIQDAGGMRTDDDKRERTFGGVFFYVVKRDWHQGLGDMETELDALDP